MNKKSPLAASLSLGARAFCKACFLAAVGGLLAFGVPVAANAQTAPVVINFEGLEPVKVVSQFASQGAIFNGPTARDYSQTPGFAHSGTRAIELCFAAEFCTVPLDIRFTAGQAHTKLWVGYSGPLGQASTVILQAFDQNGARVGQVSAVLGPSNRPIAVQTPLEINSPSPIIRQLVLMFAPNPGGPAFNNGLVVDDVEFSTAGPPPPCPTTLTPSVTLSQPLNDETTRINEFLLQGMVTTGAPLNQAKLTVVGPGGSKTTDLLGSIVPEAGGTFGATRVDGSLSPGLNTVTLLVGNCRGTATASKKVTFTPIAAGTKFRFLGMEITQATQDLRNSVPLVAGKPTVVRVYLSVQGPTQLIGEVTGAITASHPGGASLPNWQSANAITVNSSQDVRAKRHDLQASLNFILPPEWSAAGTLHFQVSKLYIQGQESHLPCDGCGNLDEINAPRYVQFSPTRPLNLVLVPYVYAISATPTPDILFTPMGSLQWLNNVYPVSGNFPEDGAGVRLLRILPTRSTNKNLHNDDDGDDFIDDLQDIFNDLQDQAGSSWPSDVHLFAMTPCGCGGRGASPGNVAYGDTWNVETGPVQDDKYEFYGALWAQEIAHNFGLNHAGNAHDEMPPQDLGFPYPHGGIGEPGLAIITEWWNGSPFLIEPGVPALGKKHAHDFMSYGDVNDSADHTYDWVSPYTYQDLFRSFEELGQSRRSTAQTEKLVVLGRIGRDGTVTLRPFNRVTTSYSSGPGTAGELSVDLVDAGGRTLLSHHFSARHVGGSNASVFNEFVPWKAGTQLILIKRGGVVLAKRTVSPHKPWVRVVSPKGGETWGAKATITWEAGDDDHDPLTYTVLYNSGLDPSWIPIASGVTGLSTTVDTALLPGSPKARIRVRATDGVNTAEAESGGTFAVPDKSPLVVILGPVNGQTIPAGTPLRLIGAAYDPEDGMLPSSSLTWTSDRDGLMGQGERLRMRSLSRGPHVITLTATDSQGRVVKARVNVTVGREQ